MIHLDLGKLDPAGRRFLVGIASGCRDQAPAMLDRLAAAIATGDDVVAFDPVLPPADAVVALSACLAHAVTCDGYAHEETDDVARDGFAMLANLFLILHGAIYQHADHAAVAAIRAQLSRSVTPATA